VGNGDPVNPWGGGVRKDGEGFINRGGMAWPRGRKGGSGRMDHPTNPGKRRE